VTRLLIASVLALAACACATEDEPSRSLISVATPATVAGQLEVSVEEGPVGDDDLSEINFGSIATDDGVVLIAVPADVARSSGVTRDELVAGGPFEVDLVGPFTVADPAAPTYLAGALRAGGD
jgi:hypothetical protein